MANHNQFGRLIRGECKHSHDRRGKFAKIRDDAAILTILKREGASCFDKGLTHQEVAVRLAPDPDEVSKIYERLRQRTKNIDSLAGLGSRGAESPGSQRNYWHWHL
jgi:hypothetical protein